MIVNNKQNAATQTGDVTTSDLSASSTLVSTYSVILKSHTVLGQVIDQLGLPYTYDQLAGMISVSTVNNTQVMRITVRCGDSQTALEIVSKLVEIAPRVIVDKAEVGSVKTVDEPWTSGKIVSPSKKKYALAGFAAGFLAMCAIFILRELLNNTYKTEADITKDLGLPVLGVIPLEEGGVVGRSRK
jgi:capsular polysaccharide biosynthesis protein